MVVAEVVDEDGDAARMEVKEEPSSSSPSSWSSPPSGEGDNGDVGGGPDGSGAGAAGGRPRSPPPSARPSPRSYHGDEGGLRGEFPSHPSVAIDAPAGEPTGGLDWEEMTGVASSGPPSRGEAEADGIEPREPEPFEFGGDDKVSSPPRPSAPPGADDAGRGTDVSPMLRGGRGGGSRRPFWPPGPDGAAKRPSDGYGDVMFWNFVRCGRRGSGRGCWFPANRSG